MQDDGIFGEDANGPIRNTQYIIGFECKPWSHNPKTPHKEVWSNSTDTCHALQDDGTFGEDADGAGLAASPGSTSLGEDTSEDEDDEDGDAAEHRVNVRTGQPFSSHKIRLKLSDCLNLRQVTPLKPSSALHVMGGLEYARGAATCCQPHTNTHTCTRTHARVSTQPV